MTANPTTTGPDVGKDSDVIDYREIFPQALKLNSFFQFILGWSSYGYLYKTISIGY